MWKPYYLGTAIIAGAFLMSAGCGMGDDDDDDDDSYYADSGSSADMDSGPIYAWQEEEPPWGEGGAGGAGGETAATGGTGGEAYAEEASDAGTEPEPEPEPNEGDMYEAPATNPFVMTAHDPFSTFAVDVDTASYDIFRRDVNDGMLPQPTSVRLEEYVNYFSYEYPVPTGESDHPFAISLSAAPNIMDNGTTLLRVGIQGKQVEKPRTNLVFLVDVSGSMSSSDKLALVKFTLFETLEVLDPEDTVSMVTYASNTGVRLEPTPASNTGAIGAAIEGLSSGGSTAGAAGIDLAYRQAEAAFIEDGINHIILCTDGDFNVGPYSDEALVELIEEKRRTGITLTALGYGRGNLNDSMMEKVTNAGNGTYAVISDREQARKYVAGRMLSALVYIAKDMKIQVEFNPEKVTAYRLLGYENRDIADEDFRDDTVDAGEIGSGHRVTALYELVLTGGEIPVREGAPEIDDGDPVAGTREIGPADMALVRIRYKDVDATEQDPAYEVSSAIADDGVAADYTGADEDFQWAVAVASFAEILKQSPYADPECIGTVESIVTAQSEKDDDRAEFVDLFRAAKTMLRR
jgi:Ca-activated chloride channel family protein